MAYFRFETAQQALLTAMDAHPARLLLRGRIVTMDAASTVIQGGILAIENKKIVQVASCSEPLVAGFEGVHPLDVGGTIYPGLIELHNHPSYNAIPLWQPPRVFPNRSVWRFNEPDYVRKVKNPASLLTHDQSSDLAKSVVRFVECRALLGGVTTTQGLTLKGMPDGVKREYQGLVRNLEFPDDPSWPTAVDWLEDFKSAKEANDSYGPLLDDAQRPFLMHVSEGTDRAAHDVFEYLRRPDGSRLIGRNFVAIHGTGLDEAQIAALSGSAGLVWSPLSNFLLYGATAKMAALKTAGVPIALGCDWAPSGTKNLLGELKIAKLFSQNEGGLFTDLELARMVTSQPAKMVGWDAHLGSIEVGKQADLLILEGSTGDPYRTLIDSREDKVVSVLIDGRPRMGRATIIDPRTQGVELAHIAGQDLVLDIVENDKHPLAGTTLAAATASLSYALEHLPDLAGQFARMHDLRDGARTSFVCLEMDEADASALVAGTTPIGPGDVDPMRLDPITEVDDLNFIPHIKANPNIPSWLREGL